MKHASLLLLACVFLNGCFWDKDDGNISVQFENRTDKEIVIYYDINEKRFDIDYISNKKEKIQSGKTEWIEVEDEFYDADVIIEYDGIKKKFDIDPNFWAEDKVIVKITDFASDG